MPRASGWVNRPAVPFWRGVSSRIVTPIGGPIAEPTTGMQSGSALTSMGEQRLRPAPSGEHRKSFATTHFPLAVPLFPLARTTPSRRAGTHIFTIPWRSPWRLPPREGTGEQAAISIGSIIGYVVPPLVPPPGGFLRGSPPPSQQHGSAAVHTLSRGSSSVVTA